jgi:short-subunit dehydrogenase
MLSFLLPILGLVVVIQVIHKVYLWFWQVYQLVPTDLVKTYGKGSWCIISGGTSDTGYAFARHLAAKGFNLVLIAKTAEKLNKKAAQLKADFKGVQVQTIVTDFGKNDTIEYYEGLLDEIKSDNVSMLINCQGKNCGFFLNETLENVRDCVVINTVPTFLLTRVFLFKYPGSAENRKAIIAMSAHNNELELNTKSVWISVKHAINMLFQSESQNFFKIGTDMLSIKPVNISTAEKKDWLTCSPEELVSDSFDVLGQIEETFGSKRHIAYGWASECIRFL